MILSWLKQRKRNAIRGTPFPEEWIRILDRNVEHYRHLDPAEKQRLHDDLRIFMSEKFWEGCGGLTITDEIKVTISAQVCLLVLGMDHNYFDRVLSILVYPHGYKDAEAREGYLVGASARLGESHYRGPVILAWDEVLRDARNPRAGKNLVYHEFAHQLDMLDGFVDGTPPLPNPADVKRWHEIMTAEYDALVRASEQGRATLLDQYGTTNEAEFFAVATECFFDKPVPMRQRHPQLYDLLRAYYRQDPAARCERRES